ncbi:hypothetical protein HanRHA438_Chr15g0725691 [Helianthus annuus]|nr:hypothetical protein HanRHA438_Chr15g0725691 [Helianthus annuus]
MVAEITPRTPPPSRLRTVTMLVLDKAAEALVAASGREAAVVITSERIMRVTFGKILEW